MIKAICKYSIYLLIFISGGGLFAQEGLTLTFVNSEPIGAYVVIDGERLIDKTPLIVDNIAPGRHWIEVRKEGYESQGMYLDVVTGRIKSISVSLEKKYTGVQFYGEEEIIQGVKSFSGNTIFIVPEGRYSFYRKDNMLYVESVFPDQGVIDALNVALPVLSVAAGAFTYQELSNPGSDDFAISPALMGTYSLLGAMALLDIGLNIKKGMYLDAYRIETTDPFAFEGKAAEYYNEAEQLLSLGRFDEAKDMFSTVLAQFKESKYYPQALFKLAKIHYLTEDSPLAETEFRLIINVYPDSELYDKALKNLGDIYLAENRFEEAMDVADKITYFQGSFTYEEIDYYRCTVLEGWYAQKEFKLNDVIAAYKGMIKTYPESEDKVVYLYKTAYYLHLADQDASADSYLAELPSSYTEHELFQDIESLRKELEYR